ncbi:organic hydroperoxide reductase OsmC/OhrA [Mucilaginibacter gracilis]|uniref:Organic hydroperoxide reductase OsmC/OhrA n=1 Tax=Mucilaginibacter gracilis TaxID=423350 RepID=A0A495J248_9SPHI|nr:OsmC family protein [Mucilaginibacter gracilis]RKR82394.1 organic hydroperoxide reductase OsmC/OhrA [Mucilaginibacter gracilis]
MNKSHHYNVKIEWTGNTGSGTSSYTAYERQIEVSSIGKPVIPTSSDPAFRGDKSRYNPEELLVASLSSCHMLWYLHLCAENGIVVVKYKDEATGIMTETANGSGKFESVTLKPVVYVSEPQMIENAIALHKKANEMCYVAKSCNFPVYHEPDCNTDEK